MKKIKIVWVLMISAFLFSCGGGSDSKPADQVDKLIKSIEKGDYDTAIDCLAMEGKTLTDEEKTKLNAMLGMTKGVIDSKKGIASSEVIEENVSEDGNTATVKIKYVYGNGDEDTSEYNLVKEDGAWKVKMQ